MREILVIAPFDLTNSQVKRIETSFGNLPYSVRFVETLIPYKENLSLITDSTSVIVSRGGLGVFLRKHLSIPFIQIPVLPYDLMRSLTQAYAKGFKNLKVMFYAGIFHDLESILNDFGTLHIQFESYQEPHEVIKQINDIKEEGTVDAVIGDRFATDSAAAANIPSFLTKSGEEALIFAVKQAIETLNFQGEEEAKRKELESVLQVVPQAVVSLDSDNRIKICNEQAKHIFPELTKIETGKLEFKDVFLSEELSEQLSKQKILRNVLITVNHQQMLVTTTPIFSDDVYKGAIQVFERLEDIQKLEMKIRKEVYKKGLTAKHTFSDIICVNQDMKQLVSEAAAFARSEGAVLIYGETGTGKELFAQSIHNASSRQPKPFVSINCGALNESLLESELFGYEEGSFTGATKGGRAGLFELAHEGTLFFDEINEMSRNFQTKLLRVLQENEVRRVGGMKYIPVNVRVICATNRNMEELISEKEFKEDLFYRISTLTLDLLPLRDRKDDIIPLANRFLNEEMKRESRYLSFRNDLNTFKPLEQINWGGNARELQNFIKRLVITYPEAEITEDGLVLFLNKAKKKVVNLSIPLSNSFKEMEKKLWQTLYENFNGTNKEFCDHYQISPTTLWRKISK